MTKNRGASSKPRNSRRRVGIGAKLIVKAPTADDFPLHQDLRRVTRVGDLNENALENVQRSFERSPTFVGAQTHRGPAAVYQHPVRFVSVTEPNALTLDLWI